MDTTEEVSYLRVSYNYIGIRDVENYIFCHMVTIYCIVIILQIYELRNTTVPSSVECVDTDNGATGGHGVDCAYFTRFPSNCGHFDDDDFVSGQMCCACNDNGNIPDMFYDINIYS